MDLIKSIAVAASGLRSQSGRMRIISENIANADSGPERAGAEPGKQTAAVEGWAGGEVRPCHGLLQAESGIDAIESIGQRDAPSTRPASYRVGSMPLRAAI